MGTDTLGCDTCKHHEDISCWDCKNFSNWEGKEMSLSDGQAWEKEHGSTPYRDKLLEERGGRYGAFTDNALVTQQCEEVFKTCAPNYYRLKPIQREAIHMIIQKLSRAACGDWSYDDNWVDCVGYASLVVDFLRSIPSVDAPFEDFGK